MSLLFMSEQTVYGTYGTRRGVKCVVYINNEVRKIIIIFYEITKYTILMYNYNYKSHKTRINYILIHKNGLMFLI